MQQGSRDDASIVPYMGLRCDKVAVSRLVVYPTIDRRGGIYPARGCLRRRRARRDEGIPPYGRLGGYGRPVWRGISEGL